ncbi:MAG: hypothetical protein AB1540_13295 [Bdellovibrionota bacterium]
MSDKKFANMHYPGMKADPNEGKAPLSQSTLWRFESQIECVGEEAQHKLLATSALVLGATPLGLRIAKKLLEFGIGRVGVFGEKPLTGAHGLTSNKPQTEVGALEIFSKWAKESVTWAEYESFGMTSLDRQIDDIVRGFLFIIDVNGIESAARSVDLLERYPVSVLAAQVAGDKAWCFALPHKAKVRQDFLKQDLEARQAEGLFLPLVDHVALRVSLHVIEVALNPEDAKPQFEVIDASKFPWSISLTR